jgi:hypothetical protein
MMVPVNPDGSAVTLLLAPDRYTLIWAFLPVNPYAPDVVEPLVLNLKKWGK